MRCGYSFQEEINPLISYENFDNDKFRHQLPTLS